MNPVRHIISSEQLADKELLEKLFAVAEKFQNNPKQTDSLHGKILASLFYEPSTRTRLSFESAMLKLDGQVIGAENAAVSSSAKKGESLEDSIRVIAGYADCIVLRHPENGAAQRASSVSKVSLVNAGDGSGEHPTQALLDTYTIQKERGRLDGLHVAVVGDLRHGRTAHSLLQLLDIYENMRFSLVSPKQLAMPAEYKNDLKNPVQETTDLQDILSSADVVYMTRIQQERFATEQEYNALKHAYVFGEEQLKQLKKDTIIMHPLPRVDEIALAVDSDPRAMYFRQAQNGLYVRMALLQYLLV